MFKMWLQMFSMPSPAGNMGTGGAPGGIPAPTVTPAPAPTGGDAPGGAAPGTVALPGTPPTGGAPGDQRPEPHQIRSILESAEGTWKQQNSAALELAETLKKMGRDPSQVLQQVREAASQAEAARKAQEMGGNVNPQLVQYLQNLENTVNGLRQETAVERGRASIAKAEIAVTELGKQFGIDYSKPEIQQEVRQFALQNNINIESAFRHVYFDRILAVATKQGNGAALAALAGQSVQPVSSAVPGTTQTGPVDYTKMSRKDFFEAQRRMRDGG